MSAAGPAPEVVLNMPARAEGVGVVRQALAGMADALAFDAAVLSDMKMAVTEACTNVVVHAYDERGRPARGRRCSPARTTSRSSCATTAPASSPSPRAPSRRRSASACR